MFKNLNYGNSTSTIIRIIVILIIILIGGFIVYQYPSSTKINNNQQNSGACTREIKICPDGSDVGRTGPNCEFERCPIKLPW